MFARVLHTSVKASLKNFTKFKRKYFVRLGYIQFSKNFAKLQYSEEYLRKAVSNNSAKEIYAYCDALNTIQST